MAKWEVNCAIPVFLTITVDADSEEQAIDAAMEAASLGSYVGNGGIDKLIGTSKSNVSLEPGDIVLEDPPFKITVEAA